MFNVYKSLCQEKIGVVFFNCGLKRHKIDLAEIAAIRKALHEYFKLDALTMVRILEKLKNTPYHVGI